MGKRTGGRQVAHNDGPPRVADPEPAAGAALRPRKGSGSGSVKAVTINAAAICGVAGRLGSIEEGKDADIAIFDGNPVQTLTNCLYTIIDGEVVYRAASD